MRRLMLNFVLICIFLVLGSAQSWASGSGKLGFQHIEICAEHIMIVGQKKSFPSSEFSGQIEGMFRISTLVYIHSGVGFFLNLGTNTEYGPELNNSFELKFGHNKYVGFLATVMYGLSSRHFEGMFGPLLRLETPQLRPVVGIKTAALMVVYKTPFFIGENGKSIEQDSRSIGIVTQIAW